MARAKAKSKSKKGKQSKSTPRRILQWFVVAALAGLTILITNLVVSLGQTAADLGKEKLRPARDFSASKGGSVDFSFRLPSGTEGRVFVEQGLGCLLNGVVFPESSSAVSNPPGTGPQHEGNSWDEDPQSFGGIAAGGITLNVDLKGPKDHAVMLLGLDFHVTNRREPMKGVIVNHAEDCGAGGVFRYGSVNFDHRAPYWTTPQAIPADKVNFYKPLQFPYKVSATDPESLVIDINTKRCLCSWTATLRISDGSEQESVAIDDHGKPFELTPHGKLTALNWINTRKHPAQFDYSADLWDTQLDN